MTRLSRPPTRAMAPTVKAHFMGVETAMRAATTAPAKAPPMWAINTKMMASGGNEATCFAKAPGSFRSIIAGGG